MGAFEIGKGYGVDAQGVRQEPRALAAVLCGAWPSRGVERIGPTVDFADLKGIVENVLAGLGLQEDAARWRPIGEEAFLHPGKAAVIEVAGTAIGVAGSLHPKIAQACDLAEEVWVCELDFEILADYGSRRVELRPVPRFPAVTRDIAVIVDEAFPAAAILEEANRRRLNPEAAKMPAPKDAADLLEKARVNTGVALEDMPDFVDEVGVVHAGVLERLRERFSFDLRA